MLRKSDKQGESGQKAKKRSGRFADEARMLLGQFFASITSPELLRFEKGDGEML